jgi:hypothetical protein
MFGKKKEKVKPKKYKRIAVREIVEIEGIRFQATHLYDEDQETGERIPPREAPGMNKGIDNAIYECVKHNPESLAQSAMGVRDKA